MTVHLQKISDVPAPWKVIFRNSDGGEVSKATNCKGRYKIKLMWNVRGGGEILPMGKVWIFLEKTLFRVKHFSMAGFNKWY